MTAPIQEPSVYRTQSGHTWGISQLARRPSLTSGDDRPWARIQKTYASSLQTVLGNNGFNAVHCGTSGDGINMGTGESGEGVFTEYLDGSSNIIGLTCLVAGVYLIKCELVWNEAHNFDWGLGVDDASGGSHFVNGTQNPAQQIFGMYCEYHRYPVNDTPIFTCFQGSGGDKNIDAAMMEIIRIGSYSGTEYTALDPDQ